MCVINPLARLPTLLLSEKSCRALWLTSVPCPMPCPTLPCGQAAVLSGRAVLWPDMPCLVPWLLKAASTTAAREGPGWRIIPSKPVTVPFELEMYGHMYPYGPLDDLRCFYVWAASGRCNVDGRGMTSAEWRHLQQVCMCALVRAGGLRDGGGLLMGPVAVGEDCGAATGRRVRVAVAGA